MGIAIAHLAPFESAVRCRICQRLAPRGAKLCAECAAAVKRVRHVPTVNSQFLPLTSTSPGWAPAKAARATAAPTTTKFRSWLPRKPGGWGAVAAFAIFGALVCVTGYFAVQEIDDSVAHPGMATTVAAATVEGVPAAPPTGSSETWMFAKPAESDTALQSEDAAIPEIPAVTLLPPKPAPRKLSAGTRVARAPSTPDPRSAYGTGEADTVSLPVEQVNVAPAASNVARAPVQEEAPVPNRWDALNAATARCTREGFLAGIVCSERARLQYCDGYWGTVPQCKGAIVSDASR